MKQLATFLIATATAICVNGETRPNVLFVSVDDLNNWISCLGGHPQTKTPNFDRLAASGVLFKNAYCPAASCNPSRTAIMTGIPPHVSGVYRNGQKMREILPNAEIMPKYFSHNGYWSAGSGKILHYFIDANSWDDYFPDKAKENPFPRTLYPKERPVNLPRGGPWQYVETDWGGLDATDEEFGGDWLVTNWVGEQLRRKHTKPFFLACGLYRPHEPWFVPQKYFDLFPLDELQMPLGLKEDDLADIPPVGQRLGRNRYLAHIKKHDQWRQGVQGYLASIAFADAMLGRVLDALESGPNKSNTIVVLWSDHGWHLGEKEHWQKFTGWRVCARVPLMIRVPMGAPGLPSGTQLGAVCNRPVSLQSLFLTLNELCGLPKKAEVVGPSLVPLLRDPNADWPHSALTQLDQAQNYAISNERWRYIHYTDGGEELYDIKSDPHEWTNLAGRAESAARLKSFRESAPKEFNEESKTGSGPMPKNLWHAAGDSPPPHSKPTGGPFTASFHNQRWEPVRVFWVSPTGERVQYGEIGATSDRGQSTRHGAVWVFTNSAGKDLGHVVIRSRQKRYDIPAE